MGATEQDDPSTQSDVMSTPNKPIARDICSGLAQPADTYLVVHFPITGSELV